MLALDTLSLIISIELFFKKYATTGYYRENTGKYLSGILKCDVSHLIIKLYQIVRQLLIIVTINNNNVIFQFFFNLITTTRLYAGAQIKKSHCIHHCE